jgi:tyrosyl-tRNA synthetase
VALKADIELGGSDQTYNIVMGRDLQKFYDQEPQVAVTMPILTGTDGIEKMSKSLGNYVGINEQAQSMYHKLINIPDTIVSNYYELLTDLSLEEVKKRETAVKAGALDPRQWKSELALDIVAQYHGKKAAQDAEAEEIKIHAGDTIPDAVPEISVPDGPMNVVDLLLLCKLFPSKGEARRMIQNGGVSINDAKVKDFKETVTVKAGMVVRVGKRKFAKVTTL